MSNYLTDHRIIAVSRPDKRMNMFIQGGTSPSFTLPKEITAIEEYAFHNISGLTEVVFTNQNVVVEVDENSDIPANAKFIVPAKFLSDYQTRYPNRTVETRGVIWNVPFVGNTTLTKAYINQCILLEPEIVNAEVVIVPEEFTTYESGVGETLRNSFANLQKIELNVTSFDYTSFGYAGDTINLDLPLATQVTNIGQSTTLKNLTLYSPLVSGYSYGYMFVRNTTIENVTISGIRSITSLEGMFQYCSSIKSVRLMDTDSLTSIVNFNLDGSSITSAYISNASKITTELWRGTLLNASRITSLYLGNYKVNLNISATSLDHDALVIFLNGLYDFSEEGEARVATIGSAKLALLSQDEIDAITAKGWTLA